MEYMAFKFWFEHRRNDDPDTAITQGLARNIARLIWKKDEEVRE